MALIKCSECGKEFSDKASACPNCGCPTEETKGQATGTGGAGVEQLILDAVDRSLDQARKAQALFDFSRSEVRKTASSTTLNVYDDASISKLSRITDDSMRASERLYDTYQRLVAKLDAECRPLLAKKPGAKAVRAVLGTIELLNDGSEIDNVFSASLNGQYLGTAAVAKLRPTAANEQIQGFWRSEYALISDHGDAETIWSSKLKEHKSLLFKEKSELRREEHEIERQIRAEAREKEEQKKRLLEEYTPRYKEAYAKELDEQEENTRKLEEAKREFSDLDLINESIYTGGIAIGVVGILMGIFLTKYVGLGLKITMIAAGACISLLFIALRIVRSSKMKTLQREIKELEGKNNELEKKIPSLSTFIENELKKDKRG